MARPSTHLLLLLVSALLPSGTLSLAVAPHAAVIVGRASTRLLPPLCASQPQRQLELMEHAMPLTEPHLYEQQVRDAFLKRGEVIRWYIARVVDATAIAEVVYLPHATANGHRVMHDDALPEHS